MSTCSLPGPALGAGGTTCIGPHPVFRELQSPGGEATWHNDSSVGERTPKRPGMQSRFPSGKVGEKAFRRRQELSKDLEVTVLSSGGIVGRGLHSCSFPPRGEVAGQVSECQGGSKGLTGSADWSRSCGHRGAMGGFSRKESRGRWGAGWPGRGTWNPEVIQRQNWRVIN